MKLLLDTNACIALINGQPTPVRARFTAAITAGSAIATSSVVIFELWYGVAKSTRVDSNTNRLRTFLSGPIEVIDFDDSDAASAGNVRAHLERSGTPIGAYDVLIAGQALNRGLTLITANTAEFSRVAGLAWQDWSAP